MLLPNLDAWEPHTSEAVRKEVLIIRIKAVSFMLPPGLMLMIAGAPHFAGLPDGQLGGFISASILVLGILSGVFYFLAGIHRDLFVTVAHLTNPASGDELDKLSLACRMSADIANGVRGALTRNGLVTSQLRRCDVTSVLNAIDRDARRADAAKARRQLDDVLAQPESDQAEHHDA